MTQMLKTLQPVARGAPQGPSVLAPAHSKPRLYLLGENERSSRPHASTKDAGPTAVRKYVCVNGSWHALRGRTLSFMQIVAFAMPDYRERTFNYATITFHRGSNARPNGLLQPGDTVPVVEGMLFNASVTAAS